MPIKNGEQYIRSIDQLKPRIIIEGEQLSGDISDHVAFRGVLATQASLYDMQVHENYRDKMTYCSPYTGETVGLSFLMPETKNDLRKRRKMMSLWAGVHYGFLGRSPDYMNTALMALASASDVLGRLNREYAENLKNYYVYCREHDITLSHAFIQPIGARSSSLFDSNPIAAKVDDYYQDGMTVSGSFLLATQAAMSEEILIFPLPGSLLEEPYTFAFAIPVNAPGLTLVCRESFVRGHSTFDYPLSSRFEEMDAFVLCDRVHIPRERIFLYGNAAVAGEWIKESQFHAHVSHQTLNRHIAKMEFFLGAAENLASLTDMNLDAINDQLAEIMVVLETLKSLMVKSEATAKKNRWGVMVPNKDTMLVANVYFPKMYPRMTSIIRTLASSRLIMTPSEKDFQHDVSLELKKYLQISDTEAQDVIALNRLAWELSASSFAGRQIQYEQYFFGNPSTTVDRLCSGYSEREKWTAHVKRFLQQGDAEQ